MSSDSVLEKLKTSQKMPEEREEKEERQAAEAWFKKLLKEAGMIHD